MTRGRRCGRRAACVATVERVSCQAAVEYARTLDAATAFIVRAARSSWPNARFTRQWLDRQRLDDQPPIAIRNEKRCRRRVELFAHGQQIPESDGERRIGALVLQMRPGYQPDPLAVHTLLLERRRGLSRQRLELAFKSGSASSPSGCSIVISRIAVCQRAHAVRRQHTSQRMREHRRHRERIRNRAGVLPARTPKTVSVYR